MRRTIRWRGMKVVAGGLLALVATAPSPAASQPTATPATVTKEAYFTAPATGAVPATLTAEFPPGIVCLLAPRACSSQVQPVTGPLGDAVPEPSTPDFAAPQPVEPETLPVGLVGGKPRYTSYLRFDLPSGLPADAFVERFDLILTESDLSYALESPAFRQAILAALVTYQERESRNPEHFTKLIADAAAGTTPLANRAITGVEVCAVTGPFSAGRSQDAAAQPPRDCIFGANGVRDEATGTWRFDLSLLAQSWLDRSLPNEGLYLGPVGAENVAFGDSDTSTNWQVSFHGANHQDVGARPRIEYSFSAGAGDEGFADFGDEFTFDEVAGGGVVANMDPFAVAGVDGGATFDAPGGASFPPSLAPAQGRPPRLAGESRPQSPWWLWMLLPAGFALSLIYERSLVSDPPKVAGASGGGALSSLMARRQGIS